MRLVATVAVVDIVPSFGVAAALSEAAIAHAVAFLKFSLGCDMKNTLEMIDLAQMALLHP